MLFDRDDLEIGIEIWNYVFENNIMFVDTSVNVLFIGFCNIGRFLELKRFVNEMLD